MGLNNKIDSFLIYPFFLPIVFLKTQMKNRLIDVYSMFTSKVKPDIEEYLSSWKGRGFAISNLRK